MEIELYSPHLCPCYPSKFLEREALREGLTYVKGKEGLILFLHNGAVHHALSRSTRRTSVCLHTLTSVLEATHRDAGLDNPLTIYHLPCDHPPGVNDVLRLTSGKPLEALKVVKA